MTRHRLLAPIALLAAALAWLLLADSHAGDPPVRLFVLPSEGPVVANLVLTVCPHGACPGSTALMHYTEHLAWLSAVGREARAPDRHSNAWTNAFAVGYRVSGSARDLPDILATVLRVLDPIDLPPGFAEEEREIVLREYGLVIASSLSARVGEAMAAFLYAGNPIAASVIGTPDEIRGFTPDAARALHAATHRPEHETLLVTGEVSERAVRRALAQIALTPAQGPVAPLAPPPFALGPSETRRLAFPDPNAAARLVLRRVVALDEPIPFDRLAAHAALLATILDTRLDGGLAGPLRFDARIARSFQIGIGAIDERHVEVRFVAEPDGGTTLAALARAFEEALVEIARAGIPEETFSRVRARFSRTFPDWDDPPAAARAMADRALARLAILRPPLDEAQMRALEAGLTRDTIDTLLAALAEVERVAREIYATFLETGLSGALSDRKAPLAADVAASRRSLERLASASLFAKLDGFPGTIATALGTVLEEVDEASVARRLAEAFPAADEFLVVAVSPDPDALPGACVIARPIGAATCPPRS